MLPHWHRPNLGSKILSLCQRRLCADWQERFDHPLVSLEIFVDYHRFQGTVDRAANWSYLATPDISVLDSPPDPDCLRARAELFSVDRAVSQVLEVLSAPPA